MKQFMKKVLSVSLCTILIGSTVSLLPVAVPGTEFSVNAAIYTTQTNGCIFGVDDEKGYASVNRFVGNETAVTIPEIVDGCSVIGIAMYAFQNSSLIESVIVPKSVTFIDYYSFSGCSNLMKIIIPESVTSINENSFSGCKKLTIYGKKGSYAETYAKNNNIPFEEDWHDYQFGFYTYNNEDRAYIKKYLGNETDVTIPSVVYGKTVTGIGYEAFKDCTTLEQIYIPANITAIDDNAFTGCTSLKEVFLSEGLTRIGNGAFNKCHSLKSVVIPNTVTKMSGAFMNCTSLESINIPNAVNEIYGINFYGCYNLNNVLFCDTNELFSFYDGIIYNKDKTKIISCLPSKTGQVIIPNYVTSIGTQAFGCCPNITSVIIPNSVTEFGECIFWCCSGLENVVLPDNMTEIKMETFVRCANLKSVLIPDSVTNIEQGAFSYCESLEEITLPSKIEQISYRMFDGCSNLKTINFTDSVKYISDYAFNDCKALDNIELPKGFMGIGEGAFNGCENLRRISIPEKVSWIGDFAFSYCSSLESIDVDKNNNNFSSESGVLYNKSKSSLLICPGGKMGNFVVPNTVSFIGGYAFYGCNKLTDITFLCDNIVIDINSMTQKSTFDGCSSLESIFVSENNNNYSSVDGVLFNKEQSFLCYFPTGRKGIYSIPDSVTSVNYIAFNSCKYLKGIYIPDTVYEISDEAFGYKPTITIFGNSNSYAENYANNINVPFVEITNYIMLIDGIASTCTTNGKQSYYHNFLNNKDYEDVNCTVEISDIDLWGTIPATGHKYELVDETIATCTKDGEKVYRCVNCGEEKIELIKSTGHNYSIEIIAPTCTEQGYTIHNCSKCGDIYNDTYIEAIGHHYELVSETIYNSTNYRENVSKCIGCGDTKTEIISPDGAIYTSEMFTPASSFEYKEQDGNIVINKFVGTETDIIIPKSINGKTVTSIGNDVFQGNDKVKSVIIPYGVTKVGNNAFKNCSGLTSIIIPDSVITLGSYTFYNCSGLVNITLPSNITRITSYAFYNCYKLKNITIPDKVTTIDSFAFEFCTTLSEITLSENLTSIGGFAFWGCKNLKNITIPNKVNTIDSDAFLNCSGLTSITIPESVTSIGDSAFKNCTGITKVSLPETTKNLGSGIFKGCKGLANTDGFVIVNNVVYDYIGTNTQVNIPDNITAISGAFNGCKTLKSITIPSSVKKITSFSFASCVGLTSITLPKGITTIDDDVFYGCTGLKSINIPNGVISIGFYSFNKCTGLNSIAIPDSVSSINEYAFNGCDNFTIYGKNGTIAETFATDNNISFVQIVDYVDSVAPTCIKTGKQSYYHNLFDGKDYEDDDSTIEIFDIYSWGIIPAIGHNFELVNEKTPTCTENGEKVYKCSKCGENKTETIEPTGHSYSVTVVAPTCTEQGYTIHTCSKCGNSFKDTYTKATGHDFKLASEKEPTCTENGEKIYKCSKCGENKTEIIEPTGHSYSVTVIAPTCTEQGYTFHTCSKCADSFKDNYVKANGHSYKTTTVSPTSTEQGYTIHTCSVCGDTYKDNYTAKILTNTSTLSSEKIKLGEQVVANGSATGGTGEYLYQIVYKQNTQSKWTTAQSYNTNASVSFKPAKATIYDVCVKVKDSNGTEVKKFFTINVIDILKNTSTLSATTIYLGGKITANGSATGGTGKYSYQIVYKQSTQSKWTTAQSYNTNANVSFKPAKATVYDVCIKVKDSDGTEVKKFFTVNVEIDTLKNESTISETTISLGSMVTVNAKATGSTGFYTYAVYYKKTSESKWTTKQDFKSNNIIDIKPAKATTYDICIKVKDDKGTVVKKYFEVNVTDFINTSELSTTEIKLGDTVKVSCSATGSTGFYQYAVYYKKTSNTKWTTKQSYSSNNSVSIKPTSATTYDICVKVKDNQNNEVKKYFIVTVK